MPIMQSANPRQIKVFKVSGSLNHIQDIPVNTIAPMAKPRRREGQSCPSKCATKCLTDPKYRSESGMPSSDIRNGFSFAHAYLN